MNRRLAFIMLCLLIATTRLGIAAQSTHPSSLAIQAPTPTTETDDEESDEENDDDDNATPNTQSQVTSHDTQNSENSDNEDDDDEDDIEDQLVTGNITLASDYIMRGLSQTDHKPALQGGFDFNHAIQSPLGVYLGLWGSNVHFEGSNATLELDTTAGFTYALTDSLQASIGVLYYVYYGDSAHNSWEIPFKLEWKTITGEVNYAPQWAGDGHAWYVTVAWSDEIFWKLRLGLGVGYSIFSKAQGRLQTPQAETSATDEEEEEESTPEPNPVVQSPNYFDFRASLSREFLDLVWGVEGSVINHAEEINGTPGSERVVLSVSKTF
jgi:uncharacterized protein (TIGR02001 family)